MFVKEWDLKLWMHLELKPFFYSDSSESRTHFPIGLIAAHLKTHKAHDSWLLEWIFVRL